MNSQRCILSWFEREAYLRVAVQSWSASRTPRAKVALLTAVLKVLKHYRRQNRRAELCQDWVVAAMYAGIHDPHYAVKWSAAKLMVILLRHQHPLAAALARDPVTIASVLSLDLIFATIHPLRCNILSEIIWRLHQQDLGAAIDTPSAMTQTLTTLLDHDCTRIQQVAAKAFGCLAPTMFLDAVSPRITHERLHSQPADPMTQSLENIYAPGIQFAILSLRYPSYEPV